jgi:hypothetical protein
MAISQTMTNSFKVEVLNGIHAFGQSVIRPATTADVFKIALYTSDANLGADTEVYTPVNEVSGPGYTAGGNILVVSQPPASSGTTAFLNFENSTWNSATFTANGALIYNSSQGDKAVAVLAFGGDKVCVSGNFTVQFPTSNASNAVIRIA